ncbi:hypothetical protein [Mycobacterium angelicum]|uniref:hypothetical protein n=1 Tax=Mycobacterium angelicum TaxID=470074 RepID=UPI001FEC61F3|nr:hypothetical protein [Mycobacterium angelicum]
MEIGAQPGDRSPVGRTDHHELAALRTGRSMEVTDDFMDHNPNLTPRRSMRPTRIRKIQDLLTNAVVSENPVDGRTTHLLNP